MSRDQGKIVEVTTSNIGEELCCTTLPLYYYTIHYTNPIQLYYIQDWSVSYASQQNSFEFKRSISSIQSIMQNKLPTNFIIYQQSSLWCSCS